MIVPDTKIYNGFCRSSTDALSDPSSRVSDLLHNDSKLESTNSVVNSLCKNNNAEVIKVLIAKDTTDLSDESFVSILSFIASILRTESEDVQSQLFEKLIKKDFSCSTLIPYLQKLSLSEVVRLLGIVVQLLSKSFADFDNCLELATALMDCHCNKLLWSAEFSTDITDSISVIEAMINLCSKFEEVQIKARTSAQLPELFQPPPTDYWIEKVKMHSKEFTIKIPDVSKANNKS